MKRSLFLFVLLIVLGSCTTSKRLTHLIVPEASPGKIMVAHVNVEEYEDKYGKYDGVYLDVETTIEHSGGKGVFSQWSFSRIIKRKFMVLNPDAQWLTSFRVYSKPDVLYMRVITPQGVVRDYGLEDLQEEKDEKGYKVFSFVYPDIVKGTVIEEGYDVSYRVGKFAPPLNHDLALQFRIPCENLSVSYACPDWWEINIKEVAEDSTVDYLITNDPGNHKRILSYEATDIPPIESEAYSPYFKEMANYLQFMVTKLRMKESAKFDSPVTWREFSEQFRKYVLKKSGKGKRNVKGTARRITKDLTTPLEKLDAIVTFVRDSIELVGIGHKGNYGKVLSKKEGNIFDLTGLVKAMLDHVDVPANFLLVHSANDGYFDIGYISQDQLYTPAVGVEINDDNYVLFPYIKHLPIDHTPAFLQGQPALVIDKDESSRFVEVPFGNLADNSIKETYDLEITADGTIIVKEEKVLRGSLAYVMREYLSTLPEDELKDEMEQSLTYKDGDVLLDSYEVIDLDEYKKPLVLKLEYSIENLVTVTPDEILFQTGGLFSPISGKKIKLDSLERANPVKIRFDEQHRKKIVIRFPEQWTATTELSDVQFDNRFGSIHGQYQIDNMSIKVSQELLLNKSFDSKETISDLLALIGKGSKLYIPTIVFAVGEQTETE